MEKYGEKYWKDKVSEKKLEKRNMENDKII